jgi:hypothetical protein
MTNFFSIFSIGLEDPDDLIRDFQQALDKVPAWLAHQHDVISHVNMKNMCRQHFYFIYSSPIKGTRSVNIIVFFVILYLGTILNSIWQVHTTQQYMFCSSVRVYMEYNILSIRIFWTREMMICERKYHVMKC